MVGTRNYIGMVLARDEAFNLSNHSNIFFNHQRKMTHFLIDTLKLHDRNF